MNSAAANKRTTTSPEWANVVLGTWVIISPFVLGFTRNRPAMWNNIAVGLAIVLVALLSGWGNGVIPGLFVPLGVWLFASPFVLGFSGTAFLWNNAIMAFAVIAAAAISEGLHSTEITRASSRS